MATSETGIKHKLLSVWEKLDIMHNVDITSKAYHKKITVKLGISLPTSNMRHNTHTVLKWMVNPQKDENSKIIWEGRIDTDGRLCQKMGSSSTSCAWNKKNQNH
jgi:tetrahydromethanopterin S-methyltransferase subunit H